MSSKLPDHQRQFMALLLRSEDVGEGWRRVSTFLAATVRVTTAEYPTLYELDERGADCEIPGLYVRLTAEGQTVAKYV